MIKAVFDTTVLVAALLTPKGLSRGLIERARAKEFELCLSPEIIAETRSRLTKRQHFISSLVTTICSCSAHTKISRS